MQLRQRDGTEKRVKKRDRSNEGEWIEMLETDFGLEIGTGFGGIRWIGNGKWSDLLMNYEELRGCQGFQASEDLLQDCYSAITRILQILRIRGIYSALLLTTTVLSTSTSTTVPYTVQWK